MNLEHYKDLLKREGKTSSQVLRNEILGSIFNSVFWIVRPTPKSQPFTRVVVTQRVCQPVAANKIAASSEPGNYATQGTWPVPQG